MSRGAVMTPAPTPVSAITTAMRKPMTKSLDSYFLRAGGAGFAKPPLRGGLEMDAALLFLSAPAPRARIVGIERKAGARLAADAGVAKVVEREQRNLMLPRVVPNVLRAPVGERADLANR